MHTVIESAAYLRAARAAGISEDERETIVLMIAEDPKVGTSLGGGFYKCRVAGRGKGKSGGYRIIHYYTCEQHPAFLIAAFGKGEKTI